MRYMGSDPFTYDNGVLVNKKGIKNQAELDKVEQAVSYLRALELAQNPIKGKFNLAQFESYS